MRRSILAAVLLIGLTAPAVRSQSDSGTLSGVVRLTTKVRGTALPTAAYAPRTLERYQPPQIPELRNVLVYVRGVKATGPSAATPRSIVQEHEAFSPRVLAVTRGSAVSFP